MLDISTDHETRGVSRFIEKFKSATKLKAWAASYLEQIQHVEDALHEIIAARLLDTAIGYQLTQIGKLVGQARVTSNDDIQRLWVAGKILVNLSSGTAENVIAVARALLFSGERFRLIEEFPCQIRVVIDDALVENPAPIVSLLKSATARPVRLLFQYTLEPETSALVFSDVLGGTVRNVGVFGDVGAGATGDGGFSCVVEG